MVRSKLQTIFRLLFEDDTLELEDSMTAEDIEDWDSLAHIQLVTMIQKEFGIKFSMQEVLQLKNVESLIKLVEAKYEH